MNEDEKGKAQPSGQLGDSPKARRGWTSVFPRRRRPTAMPADARAQELQSRTIELMRLPMVLAVIFIHAVGTPEFSAPYWNTFSGADAFNWLRVCGSYVLPTVAVPCFFLISGYLFFSGTSEWTPAVYRTKMMRRLRTLAVPYLLWNVVALLAFSGPTLRGLFTGNGPGAAEAWHAHGGWHIFWDSHVFSDARFDWLHRPVVATGPLVAPLWFVRDLMVVSLASPLVRWWVRRLRVGGLVLLGLCYASDIWPQWSGLSASAVFFFSLGAYYSLNGKNMVACMRRVEVRAVLSALVFFVPSVMLMGRTTPAGQLVMPFFDFFGVVVAVCLFSRLAGRNCRLGLRYAKASFFVYAVHSILVLQFVSKAMQALLPSEHPAVMALRYVLTPPVVLCVCLALYVALRRLFPKLLGLLTGDR